jgi:predicted RNA-binding protein Jag
MNTKLTLRLDEDVIIRIKNYANKERKSLSKLTEKLFRQVLESSESNVENLSPIVKKYRGIISDNPKEDTDIITDYLKNKHA